MQDDRADAALEDARQVELNSSTSTSTTTIAVGSDDSSAEAGIAAKEITTPSDEASRENGAATGAAAEQEEKQGDVTRSDGQRHEGATCPAGAGEETKDGQAAAIHSAADGRDAGTQSTARVEGGAPAASTTANNDATKDAAGAPSAITDAKTGSTPTRIAANETGPAPEPATSLTIPLVEPKPSNPSLAAKSAALLLQSAEAGASSPAGSPTVSITSGTPPPATLPSLDSNDGTSTTNATTAAAAAAAAGARASPALSASSATDKPASSSHTVPVKKFSSSLAVNKKFLEKAGEKAKPEVKPVATRLATPPAPTPASSSHPRLLAGKLSTSGTLSLSTTAPSSASPTGWNKKPASPSPAASAGGQAGPGGSGVSSMSASSILASGAGLQNRSGGAVWGSATRVGGPPMGHGGLGRMANDFPTAAEAAHAKELRAKALLEQIQARERAEQARAAHAAAKNARMLEELDTFRGKHLDPNAAHWDEDEDDFLDTTIEFADGTQYKIEQQAQADSAAASVVGDDELREPGPGELALREKPLAPGEVVVPHKREERFGDDYDRSWPRRPSAAGDSKTLFNERIGKLEPATGSKRGGSAAPPPVEPMAILRPRERRPSADIPPHLASHGSEPKARRPSVTSPRASHTPLPPPPSSASARRPSMNEPKPTAWGRRSSAVMGDRQLPPHLATGTGAAGREIPPHMLQQQQRQQQQQQHAAASTARGPLSPPSQRAPLPSQAQAFKSPPVRDHASLAPPPPAQTAPTVPPAQAPEPASAPAASAVPAEPMVSLEEMHSREMHAAAERAKKRREEEEQKRLEQIERAKRKAAELEEKMKAAEEAKAKEKAEIEKAKAEKTKAAAGAAPPTAAAAAPVSAADKVSSWRAAPKPVPQAQAAASGSQTVPSKILAREPAQPQSSTGQPPAKPTSILARPAQAVSSPSTSAQTASNAPPTQPAAWRQPPQGPRSAPTAAPGRQVPPHLAVAAAAQQAATAAEASTKPPPSSSSQLPARPSTPPPASEPRFASPPTSPAHKRDNSQSGANKSGYKLPAVAQLDDLMSRIKGAMAPAADETGEGAIAVAETEVERPRVKLPPAVPGETTTVRLPRGASARASAPVVVPPAIRGRGRGRGGRIDAAASTRPAAPSFENREPTLPFHSSRIARSQSPPPAWRQYTVRLAAQPTRRRPQTRQIKNFESHKYPQPLYPFSWYPVLRDTNPRRLSRDDLLLPKRYAQNGTPIFTVRLGQRAVRRSTAAERGAKPAPTVSISRNALVRLPEEVRPPASPSPKSESAEPPQLAAKPIDAVFGASALSTALGSEETSRATAWRLAAVPQGNRATQDASDSAGSLSALSRTSGTPTFGMTGELNGEKIESTPRKETAAPGFDAAALRMDPKSPPFQPSELGGLSAAPSAAAWPNKSLALSVLDPTAPSVWSTAPAESSVRIRTLSAVQPENSLQGLLDDDPSEVLPSSLAELKSDDGQSNEGKEGPHEAAKGEAQLRAMPHNFSAFLHESAAAIDPAAATAQRPAYYQDSSVFANGIEPQSTPSPISAYGPPQGYSTHLYPGARGLSQQLYAAYPVASPGMSPYVTAAYPSAYSTQAYPPASPVPPTLGYPSPYRESAHANVPHGITNPALIATYGYGQPNVMSAAPRYGAVGAGGVASMGRPSHNHTSPYARGPVQAAPPTSYIPSPYGGAAYQSASLSQQQQHAHHPSYRSSSPFGNGSHGSPPTSARYPAPSSTMASPVIVPQQLPPVPSFSAASQQHSMYAPQQQYSGSMGVASPVARAAGISPYGGMANGGYAAYGGGVARGGPAVPTRGGKVGVAAMGPRGW
ncbi:hypothetical protein JCM10908_003192 [Rhodotorula pacifica]|uniref:uncharacterized protein n=1 Tax=Rhodotorula pacifica TaxID=1495444 RepID=UPI00317A7485